MRPVLFALGVMALAAAWLGLFEHLLPGPFSAHMTLHMVVVALAAPLLALGVSGGRFDPVRRWPRVFSALLASLVELLLVWGWHTPALHQAARESALGFVLEQGSFLLSGAWLWLSAFGGGPQARIDRAGSGILALLLTCMHMTLLGALLALPPRPLYSHAHGTHGAHAHDAAAGAEGTAITPLADQHLGGAIMIVFGGASYLAGGLWLGAALVRRRTRAPGADPSVARARSLEAR